jgi:hypothetical protein
LNTKAFDEQVILAWSSVLGGVITKTVPL